MRSAPPVPVSVLAASVPTIRFVGIRPLPYTRAAPPSRDARPSWLRENGFGKAVGPDARQARLGRTTVEGVPRKLRKCLLRRHGTMSNRWRSNRAPGALFQRRGREISAERAAWLSFGCTRPASVRAHGSAKGGAAPGG